MVFDQGWDQARRREEQRQASSNKKCEQKECDEPSVHWRSGEKRDGRHARDEPGGTEKEIPSETGACEREERYGGDDEQSAYSGNDYQNLFHLSAYPSIVLHVRTNS